MPKIGLQSLKTICKKYTSDSWRTGTDKGSLHSYIAVYEELFRKIRHKPIKLMEIGIMSGNSILMWKEYFTKGKIFGIDINPIPEKLKNISRVECLQHNSTEPLEKLNTKFNIIIDDGCHEPEIQLLTAKVFYPLVEIGGFYIIEDVISSDTVKIFQNIYGDLRVEGTLKNDDRMIIFRK